MKSEDDIKHCKTDGVPNEVIMKTELTQKLMKEYEKKEKNQDV